MSLERQRRRATDLYRENCGQDVRGHVPFAFRFIESPNWVALLRIKAGERLILSAMASRECDFASSISSLSLFIDHRPILRPLISSPSAREHSSNIPRCQNHQDTEKTHADPQEQAAILHHFPFAFDARTGGESC